MPNRGFYGFSFPPNDKTLVGGVKTTIGNKELHTFSSSGLLVVVGKLYVDVLVVAGGGGGGQELGGGGGGGGVIYRTSYLLSDETITITIGNGGPAINNTGAGNKGQNSVFGLLTALGGGGGGGFPTVPSVGGSGGGGGTRNNWSCAGALGTPGQGFGGGTSNYAAWPNCYAGGGGGAGGVGANGTGVSSLGGPGYGCVISGALKYYAHGGNSSTAQCCNIQGASGAANTGDGGVGGSGGTGSWYSSSGGSGIVIVSFDL